MQLNKFNHSKDPKLLFNRYAVIINMMIVFSTILYRLRRKKKRNKALSAYLLKGVKSVDFYGATDPVLIVYNISLHIELMKKQLEQLVKMW